MTHIDVENLKALSKLSLTAQEEDVIPSQIEGILSYVDQLQSIDVSLVQEPKYSLTSDMLREDEVVVSDEQTMKLLFDNMPKKNGDHLQVPAVFE